MEKKYGVKVAGFWLDYNCETNTYFGRQLTLCKDTAKEIAEDERSLRKETVKVVPVVCYNAEETKARRELIQAAKDIVKTLLDSKSTNESDNLDLICKCDEKLIDAVFNLERIEMKNKT